MLEVEKEQNANFVTQNKYLLEMDKTGFIRTGNGRTPLWLEYQSKDDR